MKDFKAIAKAAKDGLMEEEDLTKLLEVVDEIKPKVILEIGVRQGFSFRAFVETFEPDIAIGIDLEKKEDLPASNIIPILEGCNYLWGANSHSEFTIKEVVNILGGRKIDFMFIDGDHTLEGVSMDYELYLPLMRKGGIMAFHDVVKLIQGEGLNGERVECKILFDELCKKYKHLLINEVPNGKIRLAIPSGVGLIYI